MAGGANAKPMKSLTDERKVSSGRFFLDSENMIEYTVIQPEWKLCKRPYDSLKKNRPDCQRTIADDNIKVILYIFVDIG